MMRVPLHTWIGSHSMESRSLLLGVAPYQLNTLQYEALPFIQTLDPKSDLVVRGTHTSKGIILPVVEMKVPRLGISVFARHNFFDWAVTVDAENSLQQLDTHDLQFMRPETCYFEGFVMSGIAGKFQDSCRLALGRQLS